MNTQTVKALYFPTLAVVAIVIMECVALMNGIDGKVLTGSVAVVSGIAGWHFKKHTSK